MGENGDAGLKGRHIGGMDTTLTVDDKDYMTERVRRERAFQWHARWAMPNYDKMMESVKKAKGLDITEADVDLLPWDKNRRLNRKEYYKLQDGTSTRDTSRPIKDFEDYEAKKAAEDAAARRAEEEDRLRREREAAEAKQRNIDEAERKLREAEEAQRRRIEAEEAERRRKEEEKRRKEEEKRRRAEEKRRKKEEEERRRKEEEERRRREEEERRRREAEEAERRRREAEEAERRRKEAEEAERRRREEEERKRREEEERRRREEEERRRREEEAERLRKEAEEAERRRREEEERRRREEERRRREEEERKRREEEERRRKAEEERRRREEEERRRREEEERKRREAEEAERRRREEEERRRREEEAARRKLPPTKLPTGNSPIERAYRTFDALAQPSEDVMRAATGQTEGLEINEDEVDVLPWNKDGTDLDYPKLHDLLDEEKRKRAAKQNALEMWKKHGRPTREGYHELILNIDIGVTDDDISCLTWDPTDTFVIEDDDYDARRRALKKDIERRKAEDEERERQKAKADAFKKNTSTRPPPVPIGNSPIERAYRWYSRLSGPTRDEFLRVVTTETMDIGPPEVDLLPWIKDGAILDFETLKELLDVEDEKRKALLRGKAPPPKKKKELSGLTRAERRKKAYHWYKALSRPKRDTFYRIIQDTYGVDCRTSDVELLPWDETRAYVKEEEMEVDED